MRDLATITRLITAYPPEWRRWCNVTGGCACRGCVRLGDAGARVPPAERLTEEEVAAYLGCSGPFLTVGGSSSVKALGSGT